MLAARAVIGRGQKLIETHTHTCAGLHTYPPTLSISYVFTQTHTYTVHTGTDMIQMFSIFIKFNCMKNNAFTLCFKVLRVSDGVHKILRVSKKTQCIRAPANTWLSLYKVFFFCWWMRIVAETLGRPQQYVEPPESDTHAAFGGSCLSAMWGNWSVYRWEKFASASFHPDHIFYSHRFCSKYYCSCLVPAKDFTVMFSIGLICSSLLVSWKLLL